VYAGWYPYIKRSVLIQYLLIGRHMSTQSTHHAPP
jgi:hypothetical protein